MKSINHVRELKIVRGTAKHFQAQHWKCRHPKSEDEVILYKLSALQCLKTQQLVLFMRLLVKEADWENAVYDCIIEQRKLEMRIIRSIFIGYILSSCFL